MSRVLPILFNTEMVQAILNGRKTVTRRLIKPQPKSRLSYLFAGYGCGKWSYPSKCAAAIWGADYQLPDDLTDDEKEMLWTPPYHTDDILYVRETYDYLEGWEIGDPGISGKYFYRADGDLRPISWRGNWSPSIHMPKEAARIWLKVKDVRVERLQEITEEHAQKEGCQGTFVGDGSCMGSGWDVSSVDEFSKLWNSTIKKSDLDRYGWDANPYVFVIEFELCEKP